METCSFLLCGLQFCGRRLRDSSLRPLISTHRLQGIALCGRTRPLNCRFLLPAALFSLLRLILQFREETASFCHYNPQMPALEPDPS